MIILDVLKSYENHLKKCKDLCFNLTVGDSDTLLFTDEQLANITKCTSFDELFSVLRKHWSWKEYSILKSIIGVCNADEAEYELNNYERWMAVYYGMKLISDEYPPNELPVHYISFCNTLDKPHRNFTLADYDKCRQFIFENLNVEKYIHLPFIKLLFI